MSIIENHDVHLQRRRRRRDEAEYRWVFWFAYPFFLAAAILARLSPGRKEFHRAAKPRPSVFKEAWIAANSSIPFAFMN